MPTPSTSLTNAASPFPTSFPSATLHPEFSPLRVHVLGDRCWFWYLEFAQGGCRPQLGCSDLRVMKTTVMGAIDFSKVIPPVRNRRSRLDLSKIALTLGKRKDRN